MIQRLLHPVPGYSNWKSLIQENSNVYLSYDSKKVVTLTDVGTVGRDGSLPCSNLLLQNSLLQ